MKKKLILLIFLSIGCAITAQTKYFNTFTLINNGEGTDVRDNIELTIGESSLSMNSKNFTFKNAQKTGRNELYNDSKKGDMVATQYKTNYYEIVLMRYMNYPNEVYLKIIALVDNQNYLIHLHNNTSSDISFTKKVENEFSAYIPTILKSKGKDSEISHSEIHLGDLDNDGKEDAILLFSFRYGGASLTYEELAVYLNINGQPKVVAGFVPNYRMSVLGIEKGLINITKYDWQEGDGNCCPTLEIPLKLKLNENKLIVWEK